MDLQSELEALAVERVIRACLFRYARGADRHDVGLIESAFHPDAVARHGKFAGSPAQLSAWLNAVHTAHTRSHQHSITNLSIDRRGDVAHCESYVTFVLWRRDTNTIDISGARYVDIFEQRHGDWRIVDRTVVMDWTGATPEGSASKSELRHYPWGEWNTADLSYTERAA